MDSIGNVYVCKMENKQANVKRQRLNWSVSSTLMEKEPASESSWAGVAFDPVDRKKVCNNIGAI